MTGETQEEKYADAVDDVLISLEFALNNAKRIPLPPTVQRMADAYVLQTLLLGWLAKNTAAMTGMMDTAIMRDFIANFTKSYWSMIEEMQKPDPES